DISPKAQKLFEPWVPLHNVRWSYGAAMCPLCETRLSTASTTNVPFQDRSLLHISRTRIPVPYPHPHQSRVSYYTMIRSSFYLGWQGIYTARSSPKLNSANHSMSIVSGFPSGFIDISFFPGQLLNLDVSHDLDLSDFSVHKGNTTITFDSCPDRSSDRWGRKGKERLGLDVWDPQLFNRDPARAIYQSTNHQHCSIQT
ncbi:hypothetical protein CY34DRAFT_808788, partial [Suillus luteus UH-Slu-Lm8-n1]